MSKEKNKEYRSDKETEDEEIKDISILYGTTWGAYEAIKKREEYYRRYGKHQKADAFQISRESLFISLHSMERLLFGGIIEEAKK